MLLSAAHAAVRTAALRQRPHLGGERLDRDTQGVRLVADVVGEEDHQPARPPAPERDATEGGGTDRGVGGGQQHGRAPGGCFARCLLARVEPEVYQTPVVTETISIFRSGEFINFSRLNRRPRTGRVRLELRFDCAEPDDRLVTAVKFLADAVTRTGRVKAYLDSHPQYRLAAS
jgi:hypothetical protein